MIGGTIYRVKVVSGSAVLSIPDLKEGTYEVTASYAGNVKYNGASETVSFTVSKYDLYMNVTAPDVHYGENATVSVSVPSDVPGNIKFVIGGTIYRVKVVSGSAVLSVPDLKEGTYEVTVSYAGNVKYKPGSATTSFTVSRTPLVMQVTVDDIMYGENATISVSVPKDLPGNIKFLVDGVSYKVKVVSGKATLSVPNLKAGVHNVTVSYAGNVKYTPAVVETTFNVNKWSPNLTASANNINQGTDATISVSIAKDAPGNVRITVDGTEYRIKITSGKATLNVAGLSKGTYDVSVTYAGNVKYESALATTTFKVN